MAKSNDKTEDLWQLDGVSEAARAAAARAAAAAGLSLGAWLESAIRDARSGTDAGTSRDDIVAAIEMLNARIASAESVTRQSVEPLRERLDSLSHQITEIEQSGNQKVPSEDG